MAVLRALRKEDCDRCDIRAVTTGDTVSLGDRTLRFLTTPYVH